MGFTESTHAGMSKLLISVFKAGQSVPLDVKMDPESYMPSLTVVTMSLEKLARQYQHQLRDKLRNSILSIGGAISINGVNITVQGKLYYDMTLHYVLYERPTLVFDETRV